MDTGLHPAAHVAPVVEVAAQFGGEVARGIQRPGQRFKLRGYFDDGALDALLVLRAFGPRVFQLLPHRAGPHRRGHPQLRLVAPGANELRVVQYACEAFEETPHRRAELQGSLPGLFDGWSQLDRNSRAVCRGDQTQGFAQRPPSAWTLAPQSIEATQQLAFAQPPPELVRCLVLEV